MPHQSRVLFKTVILFDDFNRKKEAMKTLGIILFFLICQNVDAALIEGNFNIFQGTLSRTETHKNAKTFASFGIFVNLNRGEKARYFAGWYVMSVSSTDDLSPSINEKLTSSDMGPAFRWNIDRNSMFSATFAYGILCKGKYSTDGGTDEDLSGSSYLLKVAMEPEVAENFNIGIAINYYNANYNKKVINSTESSVSEKNTWMFPSLSLAWRF